MFSNLTAIVTGSPLARYTVPTCPLAVITGPYSLDWPLVVNSAVNAEAECPPVLISGFPTYNALVVFQRVATFHQFVSGSAYADGCPDAYRSAAPRACVPHADRRPVPNLRGAKFR